MQVKVPASCTTIKEATATINGVRVIAFDGEILTLEITAPTAPTAQGEAPAAEKKTTAKTDNGRKNMNDEALKARAAKAAETRRVKKLCAEYQIEYKPGMTEEDVRRIIEANKANAEAEEVVEEVAEAEDEDVEIIV